MENDKVAKEPKSSKSRKRGQGEGSIFERSDGRWCGCMSVGGYKNGRPKRKYYYGSTRGEVVEKMTKGLRDLQQGVLPSDDRMRLGQYLDQWLEYSVKPSVRAITHESYSQLVRLHLKPGLGPIPISKLSPSDVREFMNTKLKSGLSPRTVLYCRAVLRRALRQAVSDGTISRNAAALADPPHYKKSDVKIFTEEQATTFIQAIENDRLKALYLLTLCLGLRRGEALGLKWAALDIENSTLHVRDALQRIGGKLQLVELKTKKSRRTLQIPNILLPVLKTHRVRQLEERIKMGEKWHETGFVFTTPIGTPLEPRNVLRHYHAALKTAKLPRMRFHDLRHSCASILLAQGIPLRTVMEVLGHSSIRVTGDVYGHVAARLMSEAAAAMDTALSPKRKRSRARRKNTHSLPVASDIRLDSRANELAR